MSEKRYFTMEDNQQLIYFQLPKVLMVAEKYKKLSNDAKLLYTYYLDLNKKSMTRGWKDDQGRYYIKFKDSNGMTFIGCRSEKFAKLKKELKTYDLIDTKQMGQGKTNITYVLKLEYTEEDVYRANEVFDEVADEADKTDEKAEVRKSNIPTESNEVRKSNAKEFENRTSKNSKIEDLEIRKSNNINKNDLKENYLNENNSSDNYSSSSLELDNTDYIVDNQNGLTEEEEDNRAVKRRLMYLGNEIADSGIMRTNKDINKTISLMVDFGMVKFDSEDVKRAIEHYKEECKTKRIGMPPTYFVTGFEIKMNERHSSEVGQTFANLQNTYTGAIPFFNWLED